MGEWHRDNPELIGTGADPWMIHESYRKAVGQGPVGEPVDRDDFLEPYEVDIVDDSDEYVYTFECQAEDREHAMEQALDACVPDVEHPKTVRRA